MPFLYPQYMLAIIFLLMAGCVPITLTPPTTPLPSTPIIPLDTSPPGKPIYLTVNVPKQVCPKTTNKVTVSSVTCPPVPIGCRVSVKYTKDLKSYVPLTLPPGIPTDVTIHEVVQHHAATLAIVLENLRKSESLIAKVATNVECH